MKNFIACSYCKKSFYRSISKINEANKFGWRQFCSKQCQSFAKNKQKIFHCANFKCGRSFKRRIYKNTIKAYCSHFCAASVNNYRFPKRIAIIKHCLICKKQFKTNRKYCSLLCKNQSQVLSKEHIIKEINSFFKNTGRIPLKREFYSYSAARRNFGNWNNAIKASGFKPNPIIFSKKYIAKDGHKCDSFSEKIIDDWLNSKSIEHKRSFAYPGDNNLTVDFLIGNYWIEFFGLYKHHKKYDKLRKQKLEIAKEHGLNLIEIYPKDLFPTNRLDKVLSMLLGSDLYEYSLF